MATTQLEVNPRANAEMYYGEEAKKRYPNLLAEFNLPRGLMPMENVEEIGIVRSTGFHWVKQTKKTEHKIKQINQTVVFDVEVSSYISDRRLKKITGLKSKELLISVTICDIYIDDPASGKITFKVPAGLTRSYPIEVFELEEKKDGSLTSKN